MRCSLSAPIQNAFEPAIQESRSASMKSAETSMYWRTFSSGVGAASTAARTESISARSESRTMRWNSASLLGKW
ncbi:hypothetical protein D3C78_1941670 [compost metagenome]